MIGSYLDTKRNIVTFSESPERVKQSKKNFNGTFLKAKNLQLANALETSKDAEHKEINKAIRYLRWCGTHAMYSERPDVGFDLESGSHTCDHKFCHTCNKARAAKLSTRFYSLLEDAEYKRDTKGLYYYFVTFTLKHGSLDTDGNVIRSGNYTKELRSYLTKMYRSVLWQRNFRNCDNWGQISNIENVIKTDYHIHSHAILMAKPLAGKVNDIQNQIRAKWKKITGDSTGFDLKLIKSKDLHSDVLELMKYTTSMKDTDYDKMPVTRLNLLANWIIESKGKNFINASGYFRGKQITSDKSELDVKPDAKEYDFNRRFFIDKVAKVWLSVPKGKSLSKEDKDHYFKKAIEDIVILKLSPDALDITDHMEHAKDLLGFETIDSMRRFLDNIKEDLSAYAEYDLDGFTIPLSEDRLNNIMRIKTQVRAG